MQIRDIEKLAKLARIELTDAEKEKFAGDLESILGYVSQIQEVVTEDLPAQAGKPAEVGGVFNVLRVDADPTESGKYTERILAEAPDTEKNFVKVKKIL